jgi:hypothetical protein
MSFGWQIPSRDTAEKASRHASGAKRGTSRLAAKKELTEVATKEAGTNLL